MKTGKEIKSFKRVLLLYSLVFVLVIFATTAVSYIGSANKMKTQLTYSNMVILKQINQNIDLRLKEIDKAVINLIQDSDLRQYMDYNYSGETEHLVSMYQLKEKIKSMNSSNDNIYSIYVYSMAKNSILTDNTECKVGEFWDKDWLDELNNMENYYEWAGTRELHEMISGIPRDKNIVTLTRTYPLSSNYPQDRKGAVAVSIDEDLLFRIINNSIPNQLGHIFLIDKNGKVLSHDDKSQLYKDMSNEKYISTILSSKEAGQLDTFISGVRSTVFYITSPYTGWKYISVVSNSVSNTPLVGMRNALLVVGSLMLLISFIAVFLIGNITYKPLDKFISSMALKAASYGLNANSWDKTLNTAELEDIYSDMISDNLKMQEQIKENIPIIRWRLVNDILMGNRLDYEGITNHFQQFDINLDTVNFIVAVAELDNKAVIQNTVPADGMKLIILSLCKSAEDFANNEGSGVAIELNDGKVAIIMNFPNKSAKNIQMQAFYTVDLIKNYMKECFDVTITVGLGHLYKEMRDIQKSYSEAVEALKYKVIIGNNSVISIDEVKNNNQHQFNEILDITDNILKAIKNTSINDMKQQVRKMFNVMVSKSLPPDIVRQLVIQMAMQSIKVTADIGISIDTTFQDNHVSIYDTLNRCETIEHMQNSVETLLADYIQRIIEKRSNHGNKELIEKILNYIQQNYMKSSLSLNQIGDAFNLSVPYLSKIFKETTETNFGEYLIGLRIEKAKELLKDSTIRINEISERVGYDNSYSFSRIFKKSTGITPGEFRSQQTRT